MFWRSSERAIRGCVRSALGIAREKGYRSIAFPLINARVRLRPISRTREGLPINRLPADCDGYRRIPAGTGARDHVG